MQPRGRTALHVLVLRIIKSIAVPAREEEVAKLTDASKYEILFDLPEGEYNEKSVGGISTRTVTAGEMLEVEAFPITCVNREARREAQRRKSSHWQEEINNRNSWKKKNRLLEANFTSADFIVHPTYAYGFVNRDFQNTEDLIREWKKQGIPMDDDEARKNIVNFINRIRRRIRRKGGDPAQFKFLYQIETTCEPAEGDLNPLPPHYHCHMAISSCGVLTIDDINELWHYGYTNAKRIDMRFDGLKGFAKYITKKERARRKGRSLRWACSRNMVQPEEKVSFRKISRRRAAAIAADVQYRGREIFENLYPGYRVDEVEVRYSEFVAGAYIYARMRRIEHRRR